jgi:hypothetical protein
MANQDDQAKGKGKQDQAQSQSKQTEAQATQEDTFDGAAREARALRTGRARAQGEDYNEDFLGTDEDKLEKGYLGYSPTGPGENDAPWGRSEASRLGTEGEFGEDK